MTPKQQNLYVQICQFQLDEPSAHLPFSVKLAWEYQWTGIYTYRAIEEYKKFVFLVMVANTILSPPTIVDRVWHFHLLYTHSYWDQFCGQILNKPLHHLPSLGGKEEGLKYHQQYCQTLELYRHYFGTPPSDIWNLPKIKIESASFQWVDRHQHWIIPKPRILRIFQSLVSRCICHNWSLQ